MLYQIIYDRVQLQLHTISVVPRSDGVHHIMRVSVVRHGQGQHVDRSSAGTPP